MNHEEGLLIETLENVNIVFSSDIYEKFFSFLKFLLETNQTLNLTSITDYKEALFKHIYDSLIISNFAEFKNAGSILDVGSGAGLPGIPLAIAYTDKKITSLDTVQKKIKFQEKACEMLEIANCIPVWGRAEDLAKQSVHREVYDLVLARALAPINILAELTIPFLKVDGHALFYKGKDYEGELDQGRNAVEILGGIITNILKVDLPEDYGARTIIIIKKIKQTPEKFPRKAGTPQKKPLV